MTKSLQITSIIALYLLALLFGLGSLGTLVSLKYEVDEGYIFLEMNKSMSKSEKQQAIEKLDIRRRVLNTNFFLLAGSAIAISVGTTFLVYKRTRKRLRIEQ
jgi:hypothetical protein